MVAWFRGAVVASLLGACSGSDNGVHQLTASIAVNPPELAFGDAPRDLAATQTLYVANAGGADLYVDLAFEPRVPEFEIDGSTVLLLEPDDTVGIPVVFTPASYLDYATELVITSNDEENPEIRIPVSGTGVYAPLPKIALSLPNPLLDCGIVQSGSSGICPFEILNIGSAPLILDQATFGGESSAFAFIPAYGDPSGATIEAGDSLPVIVTYAPLDDLGDEGVLSIASNDTLNTPLEVTLVGNGATIDLPVAVIDCPDGAAPPEYVTLDGSGSYDPAGTGITTYLWSLQAKPDGSQATFTASEGPLVQLFTDSAGTYTVNLVVFNGAGFLSEPASCTFDAVPADALHIELTWNGASSDLDLHLRHVGDTFFDGQDDACWCNDLPSWGAAGTDDDPRLDLDDQAGLGPENINILLPEDGAYLASVHYYDDDYDGAVTATVRFYVYGVLAAEEQHVMNEFDVWDVGVVDWPAGTFAADGTMTTSERRGCL